MKTNAEIRQAVLRELAWDARVDEGEVGVELDAGIATLTGTVNRWGQAPGPRRAPRTGSKACSMSPMTFR